MAAKLSHEPGPLGSQESQHELQEPQELSGSKNNDPNESISWYIVEDGQYSVCLMGFNPIDADDFENDAAEEGTSFWLIGQGPRAEQQARSEMEDYNPEYIVHAPPGHNNTLYYIVQPHGKEATVNGMTAEEADDFETCGYTEDYEMWESEAHKDYSNYIFYLYVGQGHIAEQEARHQLTNFNPSVYNPSHDSQGIPQTEANIIEHDSTLGCWLNRLELNQLELSSMELQALYKSTQTTTSVARPTAGTTPRPRSTTSAARPDSRHDPEAALYNINKPKLNTSPDSEAIGLN